MQVYDLRIKKSSKCLCKHYYALKHALHEIRQLQQHRHMHKCIRFLCFHYLLSLIKSRKYLIGIEIVNQLDYSKGFDFFEMDFF